MPSKTAPFEFTSLLLHDTLNELSSHIIAWYKKREGDGPLTFCVHVLRAKPVQGAPLNRVGVFLVGADGFTAIAPEHIPKHGRFGKGSIYPDNGYLMAVLRTPL